MRVAVVDIGTNSTRLLIADVEAGRPIEEIERTSTVTRLGQGVDATGRLHDDALARTEAVLLAYRQRIDDLVATRNIAILTSAVRDAANGPEFVTRVREAYGLDARTLSGDEEARMSFLGATAERRDDAPSPVAVIDLGGGSTEFVIGPTGQAPTFYVSTQAGVVRMTERHLSDDPPPPAQLQALTDDARAIYGAGVPEDVREGVRGAVAVGGTATSLAAVDQGLEPYDPTRVHGYRLDAASIERMLARLADLPLDDRRAVAGLHPDRAPTIVAGCVLLREALRVLDLDVVEVSEHDILRGAAIELAAA